MLIRFYNYEHAIKLFGHDIHFYDIPAIVLLVLLIVMIVVHAIRAKRRKEKFEDELQKQLEEAREQENSPNESI